MLIAHINPAARKGIGKPTSKHLCNGIKVLVLGSMSTLAQTSQVHRCGAAFKRHTFDDNQVGLGSVCKFAHARIILPEIGFENYYSHKLF